MPDMEIDSFLLIHEVTIERPSRTPVAPRKSPTYSEIDTEVPCRFQMLGGDTDLSVLGRFPNASHRVYFNTSDIENELRPLDRLTDSGGKTYIVREVDPLYENHYEVIVEEVP